MANKQFKYCDGTFTNVSDTLQESYVLNEGKLADFAKKIATRVGANAAMMGRVFAEIGSDITNKDKLYDLMSYVENKASLKAILSGNEKLCNGVTKEDLEELIADIQEYEENKKKSTDVQTEDLTVNISKPDSSDCCDDVNKCSNNISVSSKNCKTVICPICNKPICINTSYTENEIEPECVCAADNSMDPDELICCDSIDTFESLPESAKTTDENKEPLDKCNTDEIHEECEDCEKCDEECPDCDQELEECNSDPNVSEGIFKMSDFEDLDEDKDLTEDISDEDLTATIQNFAQDNKKAGQVIDNYEDFAKVLKDSGVKPSEDLFDVYTQTIKEELNSNDTENSEEIEKTEQPEKTDESATDADMIDEAFFRNYFGI